MRCISSVSTILTYCVTILRCFVSKLFVFFFAWFLLVDCCVSRDSNCDFFWLVDIADNIVGFNNTGLVTIFYININIVFRQSFILSAKCRNWFGSLCNPYVTQDFMRCISSVSTILTYCVTIFRCFVSELFVFFFTWFLLVGCYVSRDLDYGLFWLVYTMDHVTSEFRHSFAISALIKISAYVVTYLFHHS
jgi:hypothetical protein